MLVGFEFALLLEWVLRRVSRALGVDYLWCWCCILGDCGRVSVGFDVSRVQFAIEWVSQSLWFYG